MCVSVTPATVPLPYWQCDLGIWVAEASHVGPDSGATQDLTDQVSAMNISFASRSGNHPVLLQVVHSALAPSPARLSALLNVCS